MSDIRVVLIEDHALTRMGLKTALQEQPGMQCVGESSSGQEGLRVLKDTLPDVAIVDIGLPDIDGIEVTQQFKQNHDPQTEPKTKVLILTSHDSEEAVLAAFAAGADAYCMKDIELDNLLVAVRDTYAGNHWIDPAIASIVLRQLKSPPTAETDQRSVEIDAVKPEFEELLEISPLTDRELETLELIVSGKSNTEIAEALFVTVGTVKTHVHNILQKLGVDDRTQAAVRALRSGLVS
ncbi:Transcriptional regulatory protein DegU [Acaryochloris thomasi RCC1774]|uniref:Transcriptional regulatory protein DegU n=1 Tax=Acaryochloris thomasi RCC1774 TaxID=1764569 RepID=A0A2W1JPP2_9CYAN|nr:response regulator transcription factor [Acaryochloris thomasi]PZD71211.1 Transcriptional regulatory protein DegU [Acaryochloris thomasi RCC1774]